MLPDDMKDVVQCVLADNCFGIECCAEFQIPIPFSSKHKDVKFPIGFKVDPCNFSAEYHLADRTDTEYLLKYQWGNYKI